MTAPDVDGLVARLRASDLDALGPYLDLRRDHLLAYIQRKMGTALQAKIEAQDVLQEVAASAVRALPDYDMGDRDPFGWLCQLADRRIVDAHRRLIAADKRAAHREVAADQEAPQGRGALIDLLIASMTSPSQLFSRNERVTAMLTALDSLPDDARQALRLRYLQGLPSKEIAKRMGKSDGSVRVTLTRALDKLQSLLNPEA